GVVFVDHSTLDGIKQTADPLVSLCDSSVKLCQMRSATLDTLLTPVDDAGKDGFQPLGLEQAISNMICDEMIQLAHRNRSALAAGVALPCCGRAGVVSVCLPRASLPSA